jgi:choline dehydrogenase-like flavoprotein
VVATESDIRETAADAAQEAGARLRQSPPGDEAGVDERRVIVIGSGPAGATAAWALSKLGIPVTLLESGLEMPRGLLVRAMGKNIFRIRPDAEELNRHLASDDPEARWYQALMPGGMSNHWACAVPRFAPEDFTEGERLHERYRWPVTYDELAPYYARVERVMHIAGSRRDVLQMPAPVVETERELPPAWRRVAAHAARAGQGLTLLPQAAGPAWTVRRTGVGFNSFTALVQPLQRRPDFRLHLGAHALRLDWNDRSGLVDGVIYYDRATGAERRVRGAAVVVAASPLGSTKLLLDSACAAFPEGLGNTEGLLGRYLHDHPYDSGFVELETPLPRLSQPAYLTRTGYAGADPLLGASFTLGGDVLIDKVLSLTPFGARRFSYWAFGTMVPTADNQVRLHPTAKDEFGLPRLDVHLEMDDPATENMAAARAQLESVLAAAGVGGTVRSRFPTPVAGMSKHYGGTVRMHASPKYGMLDAWNRLFAVPNVIVADASCFPTGPEKNPTPTLMALAARACHRLAYDLRQGDLRGG